MSGNRQEEIVISEVGGTTARRVSAGYYGTEKVQAHKAGLTPSFGENISLVFNSNLQ